MRKAIFTSFAVFLFYAARAQTKNFIDQPYLEVAGNVDTLVMPNEIFIRIMLSERDTRDRTSVEELEGKMVAALKSLGINTEKDLAVNDMASNFRAYLLKSKDVLKTKQYLLKVPDAVTASKVFMQLEELDISNASIDHVDHSDLENIRNMMRTKAVENARARAVALTKPLNQTVGAAINIVDNQDSHIDGMLQGKVAGVVIRGYAGRNQHNDDLPKIDFEKIRVATNVNVMFVLK
jgi:uncharacterized protein YggE